MPLQTDYEYPDGLDCFWVGTDSIGNVGLFVIAGMAPIPLLALSNAYGNMLDLEDWLLPLPIISEAQVTEGYASMDEDIGWARRGIFAFDWSDIHRTRSQELRGYERIAMPTQPLHVGELQGVLRNCATVVTIPDADFHRDAVVKIPASMNPVRPERFMD